MSKNRNNDRKRSGKELWKIRQYYAEHEKRNGGQTQERVEAPYPHFRYYRKSGHPALIVGEQKSEDARDEYRYRKVTHSEREGRHINEEISPNPNPRDPDPMYIGKRVRHDDKENFEPRPLPWKYPKKDK